METVLPKKERRIPPSVIRAKLTGDRDELVRLSRLGNEARRARNAWRNQQGVLPLKAKRLRTAAPRKPRQPLTAEQKALSAETRYINQVRRQELVTIAFHDAEEHARLNRIGWCDDSSGWYDYLVDLNGEPVHSD